MVQQEMSDMLASSCSRLQEEAREVRRRRKKKRSGSTLVASHFLDLYKLTGEVLGRGSCGSVQVCRSIYTSEEYAVKIIEKEPDLCRSKVFKEIEMMHHCQGHNNIIQLIEYFEEDDKFYLVFEKANGGTLLSRLHKNFRLTEIEASMIMQDLASALDFLHQKGIAHRDLKLENILCVYPDQVYPVKICDFDLASDSEATGDDSATTPVLYTPVGTAEYMAPEVVRGFSSFDNDPYDKRCDLWSLGISLYFMLCGYHPFTGDCDDEDCEWDLGGECEECQELLFENISNCTFDFPEEWVELSDDAKNLISQLLLEVPSERLPANMILEHPWVISGGLPSQDSQQDVTQESPRISTCDIPSKVDVYRSRPIVRTASRDDNWRERSPDDNPEEWVEMIDSKNLTRPLVRTASRDDNWRDRSPVDNPEEWDEISDDNKNLINQILRLPPSMILEHPWLLSGGLLSHVNLPDFTQESPRISTCDMPSKGDVHRSRPFVRTASRDDNWRDRSPDDNQFDVIISRADACNNWREKSDEEHWETPRKPQRRSSKENWRDHSDHNSLQKTPKMEFDEDRRTQQLLVYFKARTKVQIIF